MRVILSIVLFGSFFTGYSQHWVPMDKGIVFGGNKYLYLDPEQNDLYVHGIFVTDGHGDTLRGIAHWNGNSFEALGKGVYDNPICYSLARYKGKLYASGGWNLSVNNPAYLAIYDDANNSWDTLYSASTTSEWLNVVDGKLIMSGWADSCFGLSTTGICSFDGESWISLLTLADDGGGFHNIWSVAGYKKQLYVAGNFYLPDADGNMIDDMAILDNNQLFSFGGGFHNGTLGSVQKMVVYKDELYLCGGFDLSSGDAGEYIVRWDGQTLRDVGGGTDAFIMDMQVHNGYLFAFGYFDYAGGVYSPKVAYWDGIKWNRLEGGEDLGPFGYVIERAAFYKDELYVVGNFPILYGDTIYGAAKYNHQLPGEENEINIYMNNLNEEIVINYEDSSNYSLIVVVSTVNGQNVKTFSVGGLQGYTHQIIPMPGLASGIYIVTAVSNGKFVTKKLLKI